MGMCPLNLECFSREPSGSSAPAYTMPPQGGAGPVSFHASMIGVLTQAALTPPLLDAQLSSVRNGHPSHDPVVRY